MKKKSILILPITVLALAIAGCAAPMPIGPVTYSESADLVNTEFERVEIQHRTDGVTLGLMAHDGTIIFPESPEDESTILIPGQEIERFSEYFADLERYRHRGPHLIRW